MIEIKLTAENAPALFAELRELLKREPLQVVEDTPEVVEVAAPKPTRKKRASKKKPGKSTIDVTDEPAQHLDGTVEPPPATLDEVRSALHALANAQGHDAVAGLLKQFNAAKVSQIAESDYTAITKAALEAQ